MSEDFDSPNEFSEVTSVSWFQRLAQAIGGVLVGIVLFLVSFPLLFLNEGRAIRAARSLAEGASAVVSVRPDRVDPANDGKLVHLTGEATTPDTVTDDEFGVSARALRLVRVVSMYQWVEKKESKKEKRLGGREETTTQYRYGKQWAKDLVKTSDFNEKGRTGHENPSAMPYPSRTENARHVKLGAFDLPPDLASRITGGQPMAIPTEIAAKLPKVGAFGHWEVRSSALYWSTGSPTNPEVGDLKIEFFAVKPATVSVIARQTGETFQPYQTKTGRPIEMLQMGTASAEQMFRSAESANTLVTWLLRGVGFLLMAGGIFLVFRPLVVIADVLPLLGDLLAVGLWLFTGLVALALSLVTIAVGWLFFRPMLGAGLLGIAVAAVAGLYLLRKKRRNAGPAPDKTQPPPVGYTPAAPATISVACPRCQTLHRVRAEFAGRTGRCRACGAGFRLPGLSSTGRC